MRENLNQQRQYLLATTTHYAGPDRKGGRGDTLLSDAQTPLPNRSDSGDERGNATRLVEAGGSLMWRQLPKRTFSLDREAIKRPDGRDWYTDRGHTSLPVEAPENFPETRGGGGTPVMAESLRPLLEVS